MNIEVRLNNSTSPTARYLTWAPSACRIRVTDPSGVTTPTVNVQITGRSAVGGGAVVFRRGTTGKFFNSLAVTVPTNGTTVMFFVAGKFGSPSHNDGDVSIEARVGNKPVGALPVMVRVRKNANNLTIGERDRFVAAFAQLNNQGAGRFADFRDMHVLVSLRQAHGESGFLPWHRAYLLDLERELQAIDPSVSLHYWRFDQPAPNLFVPDFFGNSDALGNVLFSSTNPLQFWRTDGVQGVTRRPFFNTVLGNPTLSSEAQTLTIGNQYSAFQTMEGDPHGLAHVSFGGSISSPSTAPRDPLFFLLHCNVDRLWAKWQRQFGRFDAATPASYDNSPGKPLGHNLPDTMWPWNGLTGGTRPPTAPGGTLADSPAVSAPGQQPRVQDCLDYQGIINPVANMGFAYDDVRFV